MADIKKPADRQAEAKPLAPRNMVHLGKSNSFFVMQVIVNADLRVMHPGMILMAKKFGVKVEDIEPGNCVLFVNPKGKYVKLLVGTGSPYPIVAAYHFPPGQRFPLEAVSHIAKCFRSSVDADASTTLRLAMETFYAKKEENTLPPSNTRHSGLKGANRVIVRKRGANA